MTNLLTPAVLVGIAISGIRLATPYLYATIGETFGQLSGVLNLGVEGIMLMGAYAAFYVALTTGNLWLGLTAAVIVGGIMGLAMAFISVTLKAEQGISGIGVYLFGLGMSDLLFQKMAWARSSHRQRLPHPAHPRASPSPVPWCPLFFNHNLLVYAWLTWSFHWPGS